MVGMTTLRHGWPLNSGDPAGRRQPRERRPEFDGFAGRRNTISQPTEIQVARGPPTIALKCLIQTAENLAKMSGVSGLPEGPVCPDFIRPSAFQKRFVRTLYPAPSQPQNREKRSKTPKNLPKPAKYVLETIVGVLDADNFMQSWKKARD